MQLDEGGPAGINLGRIACICDLKALVGGEGVVRVAVHTKEAYLSPGLDASNAYVHTLGHDTITTGNSSEHAVLLLHSSR